MKNKEFSENFILFRNKLYTKNLVPGVHANFDIIKKIKSREWREWNPARSKYAAAIKKGLKKTYLKRNFDILYLGASHGYTPSFFSDILTKGTLYCIDFAPRVVRDLVFLSEQRKNMVPILADAKNTKEYFFRTKLCDIVYMDIAQRDQIKIFKENVDLYLKKDGVGMLALKAKSIDASKPSKQIFLSAKRELEKHFKILEDIDLSPYERDHRFYVIRK